MAAEWHDLPKRTLLKTILVIPPTRPRSGSPLSSATNMRQLYFLRREALHRPGRKSARTNILEKWPNQLNLLRNATRCCMTHKEDFSSKCKAETPHCITPCNIHFSTLVFSLKCNVKFRARLHKKKFVEKTNIRVFCWYVKCGWCRHSLATSARICMEKDQSHMSQVNESNT